MEQSKKECTKLTVLIEDRPRVDFATKHGLSLYIKDKGKSILFDMEQSGKFISNANKLNINLSSIDIIVLSHGDYGHPSGLSNI